MPKNSRTLNSNKSLLNTLRFDQMIIVEDKICTENQLVENSCSTKLHIYQEVIDEEKYQLNNYMALNNQPKEESKYEIPHKTKVKRYGRKNNKALSIVLLDKFNSLNDEQKQKVVNYTMDAVLEKNEERRY